MIHYLLSLHVFGLFLSQWWEVMGLMQKDTQEGIDRQGPERVPGIESDFQAWMILGFCEVSSLLEVGPDGLSRS